MGNNEQYYVVRGDRSGVFFGQIEKREGQEITMRNVRRLHYWDGALDCIHLAADGTLRPEHCRFTKVADSLTILDAIEIHPCTEKARESLSGVRAWTM